MSIKEIRKKRKGRDIILGRKLFCLVAGEYGYQGKEIAGYIQKNPAVMSRYLREELEVEAEKVIEKIKRGNINDQV